MTDTEWLKMKRADLRRARTIKFALGVTPPKRWDLARFLQIIEDKDKEISKLNKKIFSARAT